MNTSYNLPSGQKALLIVNPVAGRKQIQRSLAQVIRILMDNGYLVTTAVTSDRGEAKMLAASRGKDYDLLVCAGGDGTLNECISGLAAEKIQIPVGYIPCGSTNDFAEAHGLSSDLLTAARAAASGRQTKYDLGCFGERFFIHHALFGAFTWMAYSTDQELKNNLGYAAYILDGLRDFSKLKPVALRLTVDGKSQQGEYLFGAVSTNRFIAGIYELPEEQIGACDGKLAAVLIKAPKNVLEWDDIAYSILSGDPQCSMIQILTGEKILVEMPEALEWSLDGESSGPRTKVALTAKKGFLTLQA